MDCSLSIGIGCSHSPEFAQEDLFVNGRISMQHANYGVTSKHYIDRKEIAKQMVKQGFRIFPKI